MLLNPTPGTLPEGEVAALGPLLMDGRGSAFACVAACNGLDMSDTAAELARRWNAEPELRARVAELEQIICRFVRHADEYRAGEDTLAREIRREYCSAFKRLEFEAAAIVARQAPDATEEPLPDDVSRTFAAGGEA